MTRTRLALGSIIALTAGASAAQEPLDARACGQLLIPNTLQMAVLVEHDWPDRSVATVMVCSDRGRTCELIASTSKGDPLVLGVRNDGAVLLWMERPMEAVGAKPGPAPEQRAIIIRTIGAAFLKLEASSWLSYPALCTKDPLVSAPAAPR